MSYTENLGMGMFVMAEALGLVLMIRWMVMGIIIDYYRIKRGDSDVIRRVHEATRGNVQTKSGEQDAGAIGREILGRD